MCVCVCVCEIMPDCVYLERWLYRIIDETRLAKSWSVLKSVVASSLYYPFYFCMCLKFS